MPSVKERWTVIGVWIQGSRQNADVVLVEAHLVERLGVRVVGLEGESLGVTFGHREDSAVVVGESGRDPLEQR